MDLKNMELEDLINKNSDNISKIEEKISDLKVVVTILTERENSSIDYEKNLIEKIESLTKTVSDQIINFDRFSNKVDRIFVELSKEIDNVKIRVEEIESRKSFFYSTIESINKFINKWWKLIFSISVLVLFFVELYTSYEGHFILNKTPHTKTFINRVLNS